MTVDEFINRFPTYDVEDGYPKPPYIRQSVSEEGVWVRGRRASSSGHWFMVNDEINNQLVYPGNIIVVDKDQNFTKRLVEVPFRSEERKKLRFDAKYSNEINNTYNQLAGFTRADVNAYVDACLSNYKKGSHDLSSNSTWQYEQSERREGITLGGTIKGVSFSGSIGQRNKTVTVAYMKQIMYTVSLNNEYSRPSDIFSDSVDLNTFQNNINNTTGGSPAIIDAVRYGRIISLWVVQEGNEAASLSIDKLFNLSVGKTNRTTKYHLRVYGGIAGDQKFNISTDDKETIKSFLQELKEVSKNAIETAMPIEYTIKFLKNLTTNIEWKVLPYYLTYIPEIKFRVTEDNAGATEKVTVNLLKYTMYGNEMTYVKWESPKTTLDYSFYISPKSICIDIKVGLVGAEEKRDFNIMLPCIPYDALDGPNKDGEWEFQVNFGGSTVFDAKTFWCSPNVPGAVMSTDKKFCMNEYNNSPLRMYDKHPVKHPQTRVIMDSKILEYYINWFNSLIGTSKYKYLSWWTSIRNVGDLRPLHTYDASRGDILI